LIAGSRWQESQDALAEMRKRYRRDDIIGEMFDEMLIAFAIAFVRAEQWEQAQTMVTWISHSQSQHRARMRLVSELATIGQHEKAQKAWDDAQHITSTFQVRSGMSRAMRVFISAFIHAGWIEQAQTIIEKSSDEEIREDLTCELAIALARIGQIAEAKAQSETILSSRKQMATQRAIVQALLDASKIKQAQEVALTIEREEDRWQALKQVVEAYASGQQLEEATRTAYLILDLNTQAEALGSVAIVLARQDQLQQARSIIKSLTAPYPKDQIWCEIATLIESKGVARVAENLRRQISNEHIQKKAICHKFIAVQQRQWAEKEAQEIQDQIVRDEALHNVGLAYIQACEWKHAKRVSILIHGREQQSKILRVLASKSAYDGKWECALAAYESLPRHQRLAVAQDWGKLLERTGERAQAEKILDYLKDSQERASFQAGIVYVMGERARYQDMMRFIQQAWLQAETQDTCLYLFALAKQLMERYPDMGRTLYGAFDWVDSFLQDKGHTLLTASSASDEESKA
jgi:hypothetical protein